ncbi:MAG TPA: hypothetical protein VFK09_09215 [Gemmatimonadales bacterium]|jgi:hypothetical protein|nr:hypothetical protein [Gemmatimonadales bacterium]
MRADTHSTFREGVIVGLVGAIATAAWYFLVDVVAGAPFRMPNALGEVLLFGNRRPSPQDISAAAVLGYTVVHLIVFAVVGIVLTGLVHLVIRERSLRMGLWLALVLAFTWLIFHAYFLSVATGYRLPWWATIGGALAGTAGLVVPVWLRHPELRRSLSEVPLGDEVESPPAAPGSIPPEPGRRR